MPDYQENLIHYSFTIMVLHRLKCHRPMATRDRDMSFSQGHVHKVVEAVHCNYCLLRKATQYSSTKTILSQSKSYDRERVKTKTCLFNR